MVKLVKKPHITNLLNEYHLAETKAHKTTVLEKRKLTPKQLQTSNHLHDGIFCMDISCPMSGEEITNNKTEVENMGNGGSKQGPEKKGTDILGRVREEVVKEESSRRRGGEFERERVQVNGTGTGKVYGEVDGTGVPTPRELMKPEARGRIERWLEGCIKGGCKGFEEEGGNGDGDDDGEVQVEEEDNVEEDPGVSRG
jgi:hypothetical protein